MFLTYQHMTCGQDALALPRRRGRVLGVRVLSSQEGSHHVDAGFGAENASAPGVGSEIVDKSLEGDVGEAWVAQA